MAQLTTTQRQYLRKIAHDLKPVVQVGKNGLSGNLFDSIEQALLAHELIKVKFMDFQDQRRELSETLVQETGSQLIGLVGNVLIIYRPHPDRELRKVALPTSY